MREAAALARMMGMMEHDEDKAYPSPEGQEATICDFLAKEAVFKVGDKVVRNSFGKGKYRFPNDKQLAAVSYLYPAPVLDEDGQLVHGEIVTVTPSGCPVTFSVDFRYFDKA